MRNRGHGVAQRLFPLMYTAFKGITPKSTSIVKLLELFLRFQTKEHVLRVNKSEITGENTFNGYHFEIEGNHESSKDKKNFVLSTFADL